ncbi:MAG: hypothetical protein EOP06_04770 [Proteobacteria bacterium]|nr:MAG: hypothetical protein EOP06_04770 [Pseudomonadota bacterium]
MLVRILVSLILATAALDASASVETRGGGSAEAAEFADISRQLITRGLPYSPIKILGENFDFELLSKKLKTTGISVSYSPLMVRGKRAAIINDWQANTILIDVNRWQTIKVAQKKRLVLHELVGLLKGPILDAAYEYSDLIDRLTTPVDLLAKVANFDCIDKRGDRSYVVNETGFGVLCAVDRIGCKSIGVPMRHYTSDGRRENFSFTAGFDRNVSEGRLSSVTSCKVASLRGAVRSGYELRATLRGTLATYGENDVQACCTLQGAKAG